MNMQNHITRRKALKSVALAAATVTASSAALAKTSDNDLLAMEEQIRDIADTARAMHPDLEAAYKRCEKMYPDTPCVVINDTPGNRVSVTLESVLDDHETRALREVERGANIQEAASAIRVFFAEKRAVFKANVEARIQAEHDSGYAALEDQESRLWDKLDNTARMMFATPSPTEAGIAAKARVLPIFIKEACPEDEDLAEQVSIIARDAARFSYSGKADIQACSDTSLGQFFCA